MTDFSAARDAMVESQIRTSDVTDLSVLGAFRRTARDAFVPTARKALSYADCQIETDEGRTMLSPRDLSKMIQAVEIEPNDVVLDLACGRGYSTAILAQLADTVVGLETDDAAVARATELLVDADISNAAVVQGDLKSGAAEHGPFNVIFVGAALPAVHRQWFSQLANGGRLVCIIQSGPVGRVTVFTKSGDAVGETVAFDTSAPYLPGFEPAPAFVF
ncbi:MAG: protein-L-isoaspartate O-methyltransferase [Litorimonas sp.]